MATQQPNTAIVDGVRSFYEQAIRLAATEMPGVVWPTYDDLDATQLKAWMLAYAASIEVAVRMTEAIICLGIEP